jgi:predicted nucleotidyltransferase
MDVARPWSDVVPGARGAVLVTLAQLEGPVTVRALARHAGVSPQGALTLVNELAQAGLVRADRAGTSLMVTLNRDHLAAEAVIALVTVRARLVQRLTDELAGWDGLAGGWLFGSAARGDGHAESDIDLLLVASRSIDTDQWEHRTAALLNQVEDWTGNRAQLVEHTRRSFAALVRAGNPLVDAVRLEGIPLTLNTRHLLRRAA